MSPVKLVLFRGMESSQRNPKAKENLSDQGMDCCPLILPPWLTLEELCLTSRKLQSPFNQD